MTISLLLAACACIGILHLPQADDALRKLECMSVRQNSYIEWHQHAIYHDDCPAVDELLNPFTTTEHPSNQEVCLCEGNHNWWPLTQYNRGQHHICKTSERRVNPYSPFLCWINNGTDNHRYTLKFQKIFQWPSHYDCKDVDPLVPPLFETYQKLKPLLEHDPRCNGHIKRAQTLARRDQSKKLDGLCKQKNHLKKTFKHQKNHR